jgi:hypothetical protein
MAIHDWSSVSAGIFHDFHLGWVTELQRVLNVGSLPRGYYAMTERTESVEAESSKEGTAIAQASSHAANMEMGCAVTMTETALLLRQRRIVVRKDVNDEAIAILEIVSPGNKEKRAALDQFVDKAAGAINEGLHLMVLDLFPPGPFDSRGIHGAIWGRMGGAYEPPPGKPLTLAGYSSGQVVTCYVEPTAVGTELIPMPLFLTPDRYVNVPLEPTYLGAYEGVPQRWKRVIEGGV